jgi:regulatory protein
VAGSGCSDAERGNSEVAGSARSTSESPEQLARDTVYRLLAARARSRSELRQALLRKEIDEDVADGVIQKFVDAGLVDDAEFAETWVRARHEQQGLGRRALGFELRRKGVDEDLIAEALSTVDNESEADRARELVRRKLRATSNADAATRTRRLVGMLARKGYPEGLAFRVVREELEQSEVDESFVED